MKKTLLAAAAGTCCVLGSLFSANNATACGSGITSITNFPAIPNSGYEIFGLNQTGQLTGFFYVAFVHGAHAFFYDAGAMSDLGTFGGDGSIGYSINASGQVAGEADLGNGETHAFLYAGGQMLDLGTLGGVYSSASFINDAGQITGTSTLPGEAVTAGFFYDNGVLGNIGTLGGDTYPFGLNNAGVVVGQSSLTNGDVHAFRYANGTITDLGTLGGDYSAAYGVNDSGLIVGESLAANGDNHGFVYSGETMVDIGTLGGTYSSAYAVNSAGEVIGMGTTAGDQETHGFLYSQGTMTDLGTLGGGSSVPDAINTKGQIVGESTTANGDNHAFLYDSGKLVDLNDLLPTNSGWMLQGAYYINDAGQVAGVGVFNGASQWFVMSLGAGGQPPVAIAGADQTIECSAQVTLDGSQSFSPDNSPLSYLWSAGDVVLGTNVTLVTSFPLGTNVVTLTVSDPCGAASQTNVLVRVVDATPPTILSVPAPITLAADSDCQAAVPDILSNVVVADGCSSRVDLVQSPAAGTLVGHGSYNIVVTATDPSRNSSSASVPLSVVDITAPAIQSLTATPNELWPPNGKMTTVQLSADATDNCDRSPATKIVSITANGGVAPGDIQITGSLSARLAASKNGGSERVYTITVQSEDSSGNSSTRTVTVTVPKSPSGKK